MATHSVVLPGESCGQRSLVGNKSLGLQRVRHNCSDLARILPFKVSYGESAFMDWVGLLVYKILFYDSLH